MGVPVLLRLILVIEMNLCSSAQAMVLPSNGNIYEANNFTDANSAGFNHLTVHNETGDVYVGGINHLYRLNENLELTVSVTTGPEYDKNDEAHDTFNKIIALNYDHGDLITCGGYQGVCQKRDLYNLSVTETNDALVYVVANNTYDSTVGFIAPHYHLGRVILYVGTTSTSSGPGYPFVSGRQLRGNQIFEVFEDRRGSTGIFISLHLSSTFRIRYVAGFGYNGYSYFLTTQKSSASSSDYISKLVRVCQRTENNYFNSYTEVTLKCLNDSYNLAQAAYLTRPGQDLIQSMTLNDIEEVLFVTFAVGENDPPTPTTKSAICMYKMSIIEIAFQDAAEGCMLLDRVLEHTASWMSGASCSGSLPNSFTASHIKGPAFCPQLEMQDGEVLIPVNLPTEIQLRTLNIYDNKCLRSRWD
ncbi:plexin A3-like [Ptychodera flava]|uniref:plexin A3-like n=1 Tax=Ptychodera flava TaxID=63121 RepID=UPI003969C0C2